MEPVPLPKTFKFIKEDKLGQSIFILEPCYPGYGVTIGNAMRRILLSSLPGAAVTAVKIKGIDHEFSTLPNVKEDLVEIILNLKQLYLKSHSADPIRLILKVKGDREVTAAQITKNEQVEVANPELHIATLDGKNAELEMELAVEQGRGYVPVEAREDEKLEIGMIAIDAIFTPVRNVNFQVENVRVGKMTNYDKLTLYITTNGTVTAAEALDQAAKIAVDHFQLLRRENFEKSIPAEAAEQPLSAEQIPSPPQPTTEPVAVATPTDLLSLNLSRRSYNVLIKYNISTIDQLKTVTEAQLEQMRGLGEKSIKEIMEVVRKVAS